MEFDRNEYIAQNGSEYGAAYGSLRFVSPDQAAAAEQQRATLLADLLSDPTGPAGLAYNGTKPYLHALSPGCRCCAEGTWSCLFVNGICNARCFYCPSPQDERGEPSSHSVVFAKPQDYVDYLARFGLKGASLSGGEPLLTFDRTQQFLRKVKARFGRDIYLWLYTNGLALTEDHLRELRDLGLDEIRFDLTADHYRLDRVRQAVAFIPQVTVEIPALPEDEQLLRNLIAELHEAGVAFLNLHQLRCTPHNRAKLVARHYTFLHGPKVVVLESELTVLRLLCHARDQRIGLPINYCSYIFKHRFQHMAARRRLAAIVARPPEALTATGLIRSLWLQGDTIALQRLTERLRTASVPAGSFQADPARQRIGLTPALLAALDPGELEGLTPTVRYDLTSMHNAVSYQSAFETFRLNRRKNLYLERHPVRPERALAVAEFAPFAHLTTPSGTTQADTGDALDTLDDLRRLEQIGTGLYPYY